MNQRKRFLLVGLQWALSTSEQVLVLLAHDETLPAPRWHHLLRMSRLSHRLPLAVFLPLWCHQESVQTISSPRNVSLFYFFAVTQYKNMISSLMTEEETWSFMFFHWDRLSTQTLAELHVSTPWPVWQYDKLARRGKSSNKCYLLSTDRR